MCRGYRKILAVFIFFCLILPHSVYSTLNHYPMITSYKDLLLNAERGDLLLGDMDEIFLKLPTLGSKKDTLPMEEDVGGILQTLKSKGVIILAFTDRDPNQSTNIEQMLKDRGLDLSKHIHIQTISHDYFKEISPNAFFKDGILYAGLSGTSSIKGPILNKFLSFFKLSPEIQQKYSVPSRETTTRLLDLKRIKRIILLEHREENVKSLEESFPRKFEAIPLSIYRFEPSAKETSSSKQPEKIYEYTTNSGVSFPSSIVDFKYVETLRGGTGGVHILQSPSKMKYALKCPGKNLDHFKEEIVADVLTKALGAKAPDLALYKERPSDPLLSSAKCPNADFYRLTPFIESKADLEKGNIEEQFRERFLIDAFLSNWDVVEYGKNHYKNILFSQDGTLYSIDHGGALRYRALGDLKKAGDGWDPLKVTELKTMRDPGYSRSGANVYKSLTFEHLSQQAKKLLKNYPQAMVSLNALNEKIQIPHGEDLQKMLTERLRHVHDLYLKEEKEQNPPPFGLAHTFSSAIPGKTAAGIFIYTYVGQEAYTLLGQRIRHRWYGNLGGKSDPGEEMLSFSAARETQEESMGLIRISPEDLHRYPSHDLMTDRMSFRMYFFPYPYIEAKTLNQALKSPPSQDEEIEYTEFVWIKVSDLLECATKGQTQVEERVPTTSCPAFVDPNNSKTKKSVILHPPLFKMLRQEPVLRVMDDIIRKKDLKPVHTKGIAEATFPPLYLSNSRDNLTPKWAEDQQNWGETAKKTSPVPLGQEASGRVERDRTLKTTKGPFTEKIWHDPLQEQKQLYRSILAHTQAMSEMKSTKSTPVKANLGHENAPHFLTPYNDDLRQKLKGTRYTQTEGDLKLLMGNHYQEVTEGNHKEKIPENIFNFLKKYSALSHIYSDIEKATHPFILVLSQVWEEERAQKGKVFAYHATDALLGVLYDVFTELRRQLLIAGNYETLVPRALDEAFENLFTVEEFIQEQILKQSKLLKEEVSFETLDNSTADYQEKGLSANLFLFGNDTYASCSSVRYFYKNHSQTPPDLKKVLQKVSDILGINMSLDDIKELLAHSKLNETGRLFQFIFEPEVADNLSYTSVGAGAGLLLPTLDGEKKTYAPSQIVYALRKDPSFLEKHLKDRNINTVQLRIFAHPEQLQNPTLTQVKTYWANMEDKERLERYKEEIKKYVYQLALQFIQHKKQLPSNAIIQVGQTHDKMLPLQRLSKYVQEGSTGKEYSLKSKEISLPDILYHGDVNALKSFLSTQPSFCIEEKIPFKNEQGEDVFFNPFERAVEQNNKDFITFLLENESLIKFSSIEPSLLMKGLIINDDLKVFKDFLTRLPVLRHFVQFRYTRGRPQSEMISYFKELADLDSDLLECIEESKIQETKNLLEKGASLGAATLYQANFLKVPLEKYSLLLIPLNKGDTSMLTFLLDRKDSALHNSMIDLNGHNLLEIAMDLEKKESIELLLTYMPHLALKKGSLGNTPLHLAARDGDLEIVQVLLEKFPALLEDPFVKNNIGNTPLHLAIREEHAEIVQTLFERAPHLLKEPYVKNNSGVTLIDLAKKTENPQIRALFNLLDSNKTPLKSVKE